MVSVALEFLIVDAHEVEFYQSVSFRLLSRLSAYPLVSTDSFSAHTLLSFNHIFETVNQVRA